MKAIVFRADGRRVRARDGAVCPRNKPAGHELAPGRRALAVRYLGGSSGSEGRFDRSYIGVFPPAAMGFPVGLLQQRNLTVKVGNCNHRRYIPELIGLVASGTVEPLEVLTKTEPMMSAIEAYEVFDWRESGWIKSELGPA